MIFGLNVDEDTQSWIMDSFHWAISVGILQKSTTLVLPDKATFPIPKGPHREVAAALVSRIQELMGIEDAKISVRPLDVLPAEYRYDPNSLGDIAGTWQEFEGAAVISYDPASISRPMAFISTLVHEVMHQRLHMTDLDMPGGQEAEELSTDLHCITAGFGIFQLSGAEQAGWQGYLRQETRAFALRVFAEVQNLGPQAIDLPSRSARMLHKAGRLLVSWEDEIASLQAALK